MSQSTTAVPVVEVPPGLKDYAGRYRQMQVRKQFRGIWAKPYMEWHALFADTSRSFGTLAGGLLEESGYSSAATLEDKLRYLRRQFFPMASHRRLRTSPSVRQTEREYREQEFRRTNTLFKKLSEFCAKAGLTVEPVWNPLHTDLWRYQFKVGGVLLCHAAHCTKAQRVTGTRNYVYIHKPDDVRQTAFGIYLVDIDKKGLEHHATYVIPCGDEWPSDALRGSCYIPLGTPHHKGTTRKFDSERYRDERGLALLSAAVEKRKAELAAADDAAPLSTPQSS